MADSSSMAPRPEVYHSLDCRVLLARPWRGIEVFCSAWMTPWSPSEYSDPTPGGSPSLKAKMGTGILYLIAMRTLHIAIYSYILPDPGKLSTTGLPWNTSQNMNSVADCIATPFVRPAQTHSTEEAELVSSAPDQPFNSGRRGGGVREKGL